jgi:hypothetical protein
MASNFFLRLTKLSAALTLVSFLAMPSVSAVGETPAPVPSSAELRSQLEKSLKASISQSLKTGLWITHDGAVVGLTKDVYLYDPKRSGSKKGAWRISQYVADSRDPSKTKLVLNIQGAVNLDAIAGMSKTKGYWLFSDVTKCLNTKGSKVSVDLNNGFTNLDCGTKNFAGVDIEYGRTGLIRRVTEISTSMTQESPIFEIEYKLPKDAALIFVTKKGVPFVQNN